MEEALRFLRVYEFWIYSFLALGGLIYLRKFFLAWEELRVAAFGLERESAQSRLNQAAGMLVLVLSLGFGVFFLASFIGPSLPIAPPLSTPTLNPLATATTTLPAGSTNHEGLAEMVDTTPIPEGENVGEGCIPGQVMLEEPQNGSEVNGLVILTGSATIPNFGFYKYEVQRAQDPIWLTIQAGRQAIEDGELGPWDTRSLPSGDYLLRLVVSDNEGNSLPPCVIHVRVNNPEEMP
jgi:hypothetical protein